MRRIVLRNIGLLCMVLVIVVTTSACNAHNHSANLSRKKYYSKEDFQTIVVGESTYHDVYEIAPEGTIQVTSYGGMCKYPSKDGAYIIIKFYGSQLVVGSIDVERTDSK